MVRRGAELQMDIEEPEVSSPSRYLSDESMAVAVSPLLHEVVESYLGHHQSPSPYFQVRRIASSSSDSTATSPTASRVNSLLIDTVNAAFGGSLDLGTVFFSRVETYSSPTATVDRVSLSSPTRREASFSPVSASQEKWNDSEPMAREPSKNLIKRDPSSPSNTSRLAFARPNDSGTRQTTLASEDRTDYETDRTPTKPIGDKVHTSPYMADNGERLLSGEDGDDEVELHLNARQAETKRKREHNGRPSRYSDQEEGSSASLNLRELEDGVTLKVERLSVDVKDKASEGGRGRWSVKTPKLALDEITPDEIGEGQGGSATPTKRHLEGGEVPAHAAKSSKAEHTDAVDFETYNDKEQSNEERGGRDISKSAISFSSLPTSLRKIVDEAVTFIASSGEAANISTLEEVEHEKVKAKGILRRYDNAFKDLHGYLPGRAEKEPVRPLYMRYNQLRQRVKELMHSSVRRRSTDSGSENSLQLSGRSSLRPGDKEEIQNALLTLELEELEKEKKVIKEELKNFDRAFEKSHGRLPLKAEKEPMRPLYERYNIIKEVLRTKGNRRESL